MGWFDWLVFAVVGPLLALSNWPCWARVERMLDILSRVFEFSVPSVFPWRQPPSLLPASTSSLPFPTILVGAKDQPTLEILCRVFFKFSIPSCLLPCFHGTNLEFFRLRQCLLAGARICPRLHFPSQTASLSAPSLSPSYPFKAMSQCVQPHRGSPRLAVVSESPDCF